MSQKDGMIQIQCINTIFRLFVQNEDEMTKVEIFVNNIRTMKGISLTDIYNWCNRQGILYDTRFNYHKELSAWRKFCMFIHYYRQKQKYMLHLKIA